MHARTSVFLIISIILSHSDIKKSFNDAAGVFLQPNIHFCRQHIVLFLRNMFELLGHTNFLEICATSKEVVLFHDNDFVLLRFARGLN